MKFKGLWYSGDRLKSPPARGAWIEIRWKNKPYRVKGSPPARGAWIEILLENRAAQYFVVAPREGGVD